MRDRPALRKPDEKQGVAWYLGAVRRNNHFDDGWPVRLYYGLLIPVFYAL